MGVNYLVGSFWLPVRFPYEQAEFHSHSAAFSCLYPAIERESSENWYTILPHLFEPYTGIIPQGAEGIMLVKDGKEFRVKHENTAEVELSNGQIMEVTERDGLLVPIRERPTKQGTVQLIEKLRVPPTTVALPLQKPQEILIDHVALGEKEEIKEEGRDIIQSVHWRDRYGFISDRVFYYWEEENGKLVLYESKTYFQIDNSMARTVKGRKITHSPLMLPKMKPYLALMAFDEIGQVALEVRSTGLKELPHIYSESEEYSTSDAVDMITLLIERVMSRWKKIQVQGPYNIGNITYFVTTQGTIDCHKSNVDSAQCHYLTSLIWQDYKNKLVHVKWHTLVRDMPYLGEMDFQKSTWQQVITRVASAFAIPYVVKKGNVLIGNRTHHLEWLIQERRRIYDTMNATIVKNNKKRKKKSDLYKEPGLVRFSMAHQDPCRTNFLYEIGTQTKVAVDFLQNLQEERNVILFLDEVSFLKHVAFMSAAHLVLRRVQG